MKLNSIFFHFYVADVADVANEKYLTRRRQLQSNFNIFANFGFNYRFGSKLNNFVNPRFGSDGFD